MDTNKLLLAFLIPILLLQSFLKKKQIEVYFFYKQIMIFKIATHL